MIVVQGPFHLLKSFYWHFMHIGFVPLRIDQLLEFLRSSVQIAKGRIDMAYVGHILEIEQNPIYMR